MSYFPAERIVLATTTKSVDDRLAEMAEGKSVRVFRGTEDDVLQRFIGASEAFGVRNLIRVCADNPFLLPGLISPLVDELIASNAHYVSYHFPNGLPTIRSHMGLFAEAVSLTALKEVAELTKEKVYREHVTNYIYEHPDIFRIRWLNVPNQLVDRQNVRLTIDTQEDFELAQEVFEKLPSELSMRSLLDTLDLNSQLIPRMKEQIRQNSK